MAQQVGPGSDCTGEGATVQMYSGQPDKGLVGGAIQNDVSDEGSKHESESQTGS